MSFIVDAGKKLVKGAVNIVKGAVRAIGKVVSAVFDFVGQAFMGLIGAPDIPNGAQEAQRQEGVLLQKEGSNVDIPIVYGIRKVGGIITYAETGSDSNKYLWVAYVLCEGPIAGLDELWIDDNCFTTDIVARLNAGEEVTVSGQPDKSPTQKYNGRCVFRFFPGRYYSTPSTSPIATTIKQGIFAGAPEFTDRMIYNGLAVLFARYEWKKVETQEDADNNPFSGSIPRIQAVLHGRLVEPLATTFYNKLGAIFAAITTILTGTSSTNWFNKWPTTPYDRNDGRWSNNPAECLFDYLRNPQYGKGLKIEDFDRSSWIKAADKCNTPVTYYSGITGPILTCNAVVDTSQTLFNNVKTLLSGFRAYMPYVQGKYKLKIEDAGNEDDILSGVATIVQQITLNEIVGDITYTGIDKTSKYNQVVVTYVEPAQKWSTQQVVYPETEAKRQVYINEDGGRENKVEITFGTLTNSSIAQDMARLIFNKSRYQETCSFKMSAQGFELEPGDNITIQGNLLNLTDTPWRIVSTKINNDYTVEVGCVRNPDNVPLEDGSTGSFYPYGRYNEPDIIRPLYVPKGNLIYWPGVGGTNWGLAPPDLPPYPSNTVTVPGGNVPPGNPLVDGGGNGSGGGATGGAAIPPATTPPVVVTRTYDDVVTFTGSRFDPTTSSWTVTFSVPSTVPDYDGLLVWYQPSNIGNGSIYYQMPQLSNGARTFTFSASSDTLIAYNIITRIKYQGGNTSSRAGRCTVSQAGLTNARGETYNFSTIQAGDTNFIHVDAEINLISAVVNSGTAPKTVTFNFKEAQLRYASGAIGSTKMVSAILYYKPSSASTYKEYVYNLPSTYAANQQFSFTLQDFGTTVSEYDVILRWKFVNGQLGNNIFYQKINVTSSGTIQGAANGIRLASTMTINVGSSASSSTEVVPTITGIRSSNGGMIVYFRDPSVTPLNMTDWIGARVEVASVTASSVGNYVESLATVSNGLIKTFGADEYAITINNYTFSGVGYYNIILTLSYVSAGSTLFSTKAVKFYGKFTANGGEQLGNFVKNSETTYTILKGDGGTSVAVPTGQAVCVPSKVYDVLPPYTVTTSSPQKVKSFQFYFDLPSGASGLRIYRVPSVAGQISTGVCEYSDITTTGSKVRYISTANTLNGGYTLNSNTFGQLLYVRVIKASDSTLSSKVLKIFPQFNSTAYGTDYDILGTLFDAQANTIDLTVDTNLATLLNGAVNTAGRLVTYSSSTGWQTAYIP